jgi:hypothetical protein
MTTGTTTATTSSGKSSMKSWPSLNKRMVIAWCHKATSKTSL